MKLLNKISVITGGARGIGLSIAKLFLEEGSIVIIIDKFIDESFKNEIKIQFDNKKLFYYQIDISNVNEMSLFYDEIKNKFGRIDVLVANAATHGKGLAQNITEEYFDSVVSVNLKGTYFTIAKAIPMLAAFSSIILISSITSEFGFSEMSLYGATKASIRYLAKSFAAELLDKKIRVNCISPGLVDTQMPLYGYNKEDFKIIMEEKTKNVPMKRPANTIEIATCALFLASSDSSYITGQNIAVDGGMSSIFPLTKNLLMDKK